MEADDDVEAQAAYFNSKADYRLRLPFTRWTSGHHFKPIGGDRTIDFLSLIVGRAGIILNSDKFQFAQQTVDFAGFRISASSVELLPEFFGAIRQFPTPANITDIRIWFGFVDHVANHAQLRDHVAPFKPFLSPKRKFE